jgi:two-component system NarL family response regulator
MTATRPIRVLVVEDNVIARMGTVTLLGTEPGIQVVAEAANASEALVAYRREKPDVVVTDLRMPGLDGAQLTAALVKETPPGRVLVLTYYEGEENIFQAQRAGALGYLGKESHAEELIPAIRAVAAGRRYLPAAIAAQLADRALRPTLSPREKRVLELMSKGLSNRDISQELGLAQPTTATHVAQILKKLGVRNRTEAVSAALDRGILEQK